jgi:hypothetical protein
VFGMSSMLWEHPLQRSLPAPIRCAVRRSIDCCGAPLAAKRGSEQSGAFAVLSPACRAIPSARCAAARCTRRPRARGLACPSTQKLTHHLLLLLCSDVTSGQVDPIMNKLFNINFSAVQLSLACLAQCCEKNQLKVVQKLIPILQAGEVLEKVARKRGQNFANAFVRRLLATNFAQQHWPVLSPMFAATIEKHLHDQVTFSSTKPFVKLL